MTAAAFRHASIAAATSSISSPFTLAASYPGDAVMKNGNRERIRPLKGAPMDRPSNAELILAIIATLTFALLTMVAFDVIL